MSRRDTIIVAVLVNAGLIMILFATAVRSDDAEPKASKTKSPTELIDLAVDQSYSKDDLLNQYVTSVPTIAEAEEIHFSKESEVVLAPSSPTVSPLTDNTSQMAEKKTSPSYVNVTVKNGDFLEKIAKANNTTVAALMRANNLSSTQLKVGQVLQVPLSESKKSVSPATSTEGEYYTVVEGDNPWLIASRNKIKLEELLRINGLDDYKAKRLRPGDKLRIR